jgi:hypothetical protein
MDQTSVILQIHQKTFCVETGSSLRERKRNIKSDLDIDKKNGTFHKKRALIPNNLRI